jgi:DNA-binding winged helix-turn-helix (wHTH) protein
MEENRSLHIMQFSIAVAPPVGAAINSLEGMRPPSYSFTQDFRFDRLNRCLWRLHKLCGAVRLELDPRALDVLEELLKQPREWLSKIDIMKAVWGRPVEDAALYVQIYNLRKKLSQKRQPGQKAPPSCIQTKSGRGYRLLATVIPIDTQGPSTYFTPLDDSSEPIPNDSTMRVAAPFRSAIIGAAELISPSMKNQGILTDPQQQTISLLQSNHDDEVVPKLVEIAGIYKEALTQAMAGREGGAVIAEIEQALKGAIGSRELDRADRLLDGLQKIQDAELQSRQLERASTAAQRGQIAIEQLRYSDAARHFAEAAKHVPCERIDIRLGYRSQTAGTHFRGNISRSENLILTPALERYRILLVSLAHLAEFLAVRAAVVSTKPRQNPGYPI